MGQSFRCPKAAFPTDRLDYIFPTLNYHCRVCSSPLVKINFHFHLRNKYLNKETKTEVRSGNYYDSHNEEE